MGILLTQAAGIAVCVLVVLNAFATVDAISVEKNTPKKQPNFKDQSSLKVTKFEGGNFENRHFRRLEAGKRAISKKQTLLRSTNSNRLPLSVKTLVEKRRISRSVANQQRSETLRTPHTYIKRVFLGYIPRQGKLPTELKSVYEVQTILGHSPRWVREHTARRTTDDNSAFSQRRSFSKKRDTKPACFPFCFPHYSGKREVFETERRGLDGTEVYHVADGTPGSTLELRETHRPCQFPSCFRHRSGKRATDRVSQLADTNDVERKRQFLSPGRRFGKRLLLHPNQVLFEFEENPAK